MSDRLDDELARWREGTEGTRAPPGFADRVMQALEPSLPEALWSLGRPAFVAVSVLSLVLLAVAVSSVRTFARDAADFALSGTP
jgi:hypothetical protein